MEFTPAQQEKLRAEVDRRGGSHDPNLLGGDAASSPAMRTSA
jgi:hypothetical protein